MKISVFDSFFKVTKEESVATVIIQDDRYGLILEYLNDNAAVIFETFEFSPSKHINKAYSKFCVEQVNKEAALQFAEVRHNYYTFAENSSRKRVLESINFVAEKCISMSYNVKYDQQIVLSIMSIVSDGKELVYSNTVTLSSDQDQIIETQIVPTNSKKWVTNQMKQLGIDFFHTVNDPDYSSNGLFCSLL